MSYKYSGIDISKWQDPKKVDWEGLARQHDFTVIRACYGVKSDWAFAEHFKNARDNHVLAGAYLFYRQIQGWEEQYEAFKGELDRVGFGEGDILPVVDLEWNEANDGKVDPAKFNDGARKLVEKLAETYGGCIIYLAPGFYETLKKPAWLLEHPWWIAHYGVDKPWCPWKKWIIWQYTGKGTSMAYPNGVDLSWSDVLPPVVDLVPDIVDHEIPDIAEHEPYEGIEDPYERDAPEKPEPGYPPAQDEAVVPPGEEQPAVPDTRLARRGWIDRLLDWLKLWLLSRNGS